MNKFYISGMLLFVWIWCGVAMALDHGTGYIPGPDMSNLEQAWTSVGKEPKATFHWVDDMTPVEDQGLTNTCWCFASNHTLEAMININEGSFTDDFSEDSLADCTYPGGSSYGGSHWRAAGYFSGIGPVSETCQPWFPSTTDCLSCPQLNYRLKTMRTIAPSTAAIKAALVDGPVATAMDATGGTAEDFNGYNDGILTNGSPNVTDHAVIIVGYNEGASSDPLYPDGNYWICKNSWGTSWGRDGYFLIEYGAAMIGEENAQFMEWENAPSSMGAVIDYADENGPDGWTTQSGYNTLYICQRIVPSINGEITEVQWANIGNNFDWEIRIYDGFSSGVPLSSLMTPMTNSSPEPYGGLITKELTTPVSVTAGNDVYVCIALNNPTGNDFPVDVFGPNSGGGYASLTSITSGYSSFPKDFCVRIKVFNPNFDMPSTGPIGLLVLLAGMGGLIYWRKK